MTKTNSKDRQAVNNTDSI